MPDDALASFCRGAVGRDGANLPRGPHEPLACVRWLAEGPIRTVCEGWPVGVSACGLACPGWPVGACRVLQAGSRERSCGGNALTRRERRCCAANARLGTPSLARILCTCD